MFDKYLVRKDSLENVYDDFGKAVGFRFAVRNSNYRGVFASLHNGYYLIVDGERFLRATQRFEVNGKPPRTFDDMKNAGYEHWCFDDEAYVYIEKEGGLSPGSHTMVFRQNILAAYGYLIINIEDYIDKLTEPEAASRHYLIMDKTFGTVTYELELKQ